MKKILNKKLSYVLSVCYLASFCSLGHAAQKHDSALNKPFSRFIVADNGDNSGLLSAIAQLDASTQENTNTLKENLVVLQSVEKEYQGAIVQQRISTCYIK